MREIEVKVRLSDPQQALAALEQAGIVLSAPKEHHDVVYCLPEDMHKEQDPSVNWLRIRTEDKSTVYFTLKRSVQGSLDSIEHETTVADGAELETILQYMGYGVYSDLVKIRRKGRYGDAVEVCLDEVPPLGTFIELEMLCDDDVDGSAIEAELMSILDKIGIDYDERMLRGYDVLMNQYLGKG